MAETPAANRIRTRAMHRALARLRDAHRGEYERLMAEELVKAKAEAARHVATVTVEHPDAAPPVKPAGSPGRKFETLPPVPPRLQPGPRLEPVLRDAVAACPYCHQHHKRGHECPSCRHKPAGAPPIGPYARTG